jgi:hypothetical protein
MKNASAMSLLPSAVVGFALLMLATVFADRAWGQQKDTTMFPTPSGRYYNSWRSGPYGSSSQGVGSQFSAGSPNMFNQGGTVPTANAYDYYRNPDSWPNAWSNQAYGGRFYYRPMVGPAYDPFRNGR